MAKAKQEDTQKQVKRSKVKRAVLTNLVQLHHRKWSDEGHVADVAGSSLGVVRRNINELVDVGVMEKHPEQERLSRLTKDGRTLARELLI